MLHILLGRAKSGKSAAVLSRIASLGDESRQILLVPEYASHLAEVDLCRACGPTVSRHAEVLTFQRLADRVMALSGGAAAVTLDEGGKLLNLQKVMMECAGDLKVYRRHSQRPAFLVQLLQLIDELHCYAVTPEMLMTASEQAKGATGEKLRDLAILYNAYEGRLLREQIDHRDKLTKLTEKLEASEYVKDKDVFLDGFTYFNAQERRILSICLRQCRSVTVTLLGEPNSQEEIFASTRKTVGQLLDLAKEAGCSVKQTRLHASEDETALGHLERHFFGELEPWEGESREIRLREADNVYTEVEQTASDIRTLVARGECRYREITVAARNMGDYMSTIETVFARYGIPVYLSRRSDVLEKPVLSLLVGALEAVENGYEYEEMFRWLKTGLGGLTIEECDRLENYCLKWDLRGKQWLREEDWTENPDGFGAAWTPQRQEQLAQINALRRKVRSVLAPLAQAMGGKKTARQRVEALYTFMESLGLRDALEGQMKAQAQAGRLQLAEETAQLWEILCGVLDQFVEILGQEVMDMEEFTKLFRQVLTQYSVGTIPVAVDQVSVTEITRNDRHSSKVLFLLGVNDHVIPGGRDSGGILTEEERLQLHQNGVELAPGGMEQMAMELQNLYAALARPTEQLVVSYPATDVTGTELRPAFAVERIRKLFPQVKVEKESPWREYRLTAPIPALETAGTAPEGSLWQFFKKETGYEARLEAMKCAAALRRGALSRETVEALYGRKIAMSASRAEQLRQCHFAYYMRHGLKAKARTPASFDAPQIGTFLHFLLERVTADVMSQGGFAAVDNETLRSLVERYIGQYVEEELQGFQEKSERFQYLFHRLRATAISVVEQVAEELRCSDFVPLAFEVEFGEGKAVPAIHISEPGAELRLGGKVDRVDGWLKDGKLYIRVVDYKSGKKAFDLGAVRMGLDIQMLLYLFTLQKAGGEALGQQGEVVPAGVLYHPARDEVLAASPTVTAEALAAMRDKELRRSGLLLSDPQVLRAMEHEALEKPRFLPMQVKKDGTLSGSIASAEELGRLGTFVEQQLHEIVKEIRQGNIDADPCCKNEEDTPCRYCDWASACHFADGQGGDRLRIQYPVDREKFFKELEGETWH